MQRLDDGRLIYSASDLVGFLECEHLTTLERAAASGLTTRPERHDPELEILQQRGLEHEERFLAALRAEGRQVVDGRHAPEAVVELTRAERYVADATRTADVLRSGADVIYQATLFDGTWLGYADFLLRVRGASSLGDYHYEVADTKLARRTKGSALLQLCVYSDLLSRIQGRLPERIHVALGGSARAIDSHRLDDYMAYYHAVRGRFEAAVTSGQPIAYPLAVTPPPVNHCGVCRWSAHCAQLRLSADHLSQVAFLRADQAKRLEAAGIATLTALGRLGPPLPEVPGLSAVALETLQDQARLQLASPPSPAAPVYRLLPVQADRGLAALPEPSAGDLFFDIEGDPWAEEDGLEYLFGVWDPMTVDADGSPAYHAWWAHSRDEEKVAFEAFIDFVMQRWAANPQMHVYHYAAYEPGRMGMLSTRHRTREQQVDRLLRAERFIDLYRVVRQSLRIGSPSYSIKKLEPLYALGREASLVDAGSSVVTYERYIQSVSAGAPQTALLDELRAYNRDDCRSNAELRAWLEERRGEAAASIGAPLPRPTPPEARSDQEADAEAAQLAAALQATIPVAAEARTTPEQRGTWLLANLLEWHRREEKVEWWIYYDRARRSPEELVADEESIGQLTWLGEIDRPKRSVRHRYAFDPEQPYRLRVGESPHDPVTRRSVGRIMAIDALKGTIDLQWEASREQPHPAALIPGGPFDSKAQKAALLRVGRHVLERGLVGPGPYRAARGLLQGEPPRVGQPAGAHIVGPDESAVDAACRVVDRIDQSVLPIQGPPGSGKTWTGAQMILRLIDSGRRVGIVAFTHKALTNLLDEVFRQADGRRIRAVRKVDRDEETDPAWPYTPVTSNDDVAEGLRSGRVQLAAGTAWLWAHQALEGTLDTLFVDEAGQLSLANVIAVSPAARSLVLLGDPQQLSQVKKGSHPDGVDLSALEYLLGDEPVMPPERGIFLPTTFRLHRDVNRFTSELFYAGQLCSAPSADRQSVDAPGALTGSGLRWIGVSHTGNRNSSPEEAAVVADLYRDLLGGTWTAADGIARPLSPGSILVVAAYNAQVDLLAEVLGPIAAAAPSGAGPPWVGTVDKVQGQQAPVVIYSTATSSQDELPRSMEFLYSLNRLNVATSRGRCLAVIVGSPDLLRVRVHTPSQMRLANAFCRFVELATGEAERAGRPARTICG